MDTLPVSLQSESEMGVKRFERRIEGSTKKSLDSLDSRRCFQLVGILPTVKVL